jgi:hypothetical protein
MTRYRVQYQGRVVGEYPDQTSAFLALESLRASHQDQIRNKLGSYPARPIELLGWSVVCVPE